MPNTFVKQSAAYGSKKINGTFVDLLLPQDKKPMDLTKYRDGNAWSFYSEGSAFSDQRKEEMKQLDRIIPFGKASNFIEKAIKEKENAKSSYSPAFEGKKVRTDVGNKTVAIGSEENIFFTGDLGLFAAVLEAYNHHWNLRVSPDDFWYPVIHKIASLIDGNSGKEKVRKLFVDHEGKKEIVVEVPAGSIYSVDYAWLFQQFAIKLEENIKVPKYATAVQADFTTSTPELQVVSDITLMSSLQEYFEFSACFMCGIKGVEMLGDLEDWKKLQQKMDTIIQILQPIEEELSDGFDLREWFSKVENVFTKLVSTYEGNPDTEWWSKIMHHEVTYGSGGGTSYSGWIVEFLQGKAKAKGLSKFATGLCTVPMNLKDPSGKEDVSTLVAGMLGYTVNDGSETTNGIPSVRPFQGWVMMLPPDSPFRCD